MTRSDRKLLLSLVGATAVMMTVVVASHIAKANPIPGVAETYTMVPSTRPSVDLNKCPVTRANYDALQMNTPEIFMLDVLPCIDGKVVREVEVGFGRRSVPMRVWKFPREGGGVVIITTTDYRVSGKVWE